MCDTNNQKKYVTAQLKKRKFRFSDDGATKVTKNQAIALVLTIRFVSNCFD